MEHILHSNIINHLEANNILSENQHGFHKHRSCKSQLSITLQELADGLNSGDQMDCILLDFSKAFDQVPHQRLLNKCSYYGIRGNILLWIATMYLPTGPDTTGCLGWKEVINIRRNIWSTPRNCNGAASISNLY
jgi:hypothetical protein